MHVAKAARAYSSAARESYYHRIATRWPGRLQRVVSRTAPNLPEIA